jgi:hypothetical protein
LAQPNEQLRQNGADMSLLVLWKSEKTRRFSANSQTRQQAVNCNSAILQTKEMQAVVRPLPISMHAGQILLLTKLLTREGLRFYDFSTGVPNQTWSKKGNCFNPTR